MKDFETRRRIEETVLGILRAADIDTMTEAKVRGAAAEELGMDLSDKECVYLVRSVVDGFVLSLPENEVSPPVPERKEVTIDGDTRRKIEDTVLEILRTVDFEKTSEDEVRTAAAEQLGMDLEERAAFYLVKSVIRGYIKMLKEIDRGSMEGDTRQKIEETVLHILKTSDLWTVMELVVLAKASELLGVDLSGVETSLFVRSAIQQHLKEAMEGKQIKTDKVVRAEEKMTGGKPNLPREEMQELRRKLKNELGLLKKAMSHKGKQVKRRDTYRSWTDEEFKRVCDQYCKEIEATVRQSLRSASGKLGWSDDEVCATEEESEAIEEAHKAKTKGPSFADSRMQVEKMITEERRDVPKKLVQEELKNNQEPGSPQEAMTVQKRKCKEAEPSFTLPHLQQGLSKQPHKSCTGEDLKKTSQKYYSTELVECIPQSLSSEAGKPGSSDGEKCYTEYGSKATGDAADAMSCDENVQE